MEKRGKWLCKMTVFSVLFGIVFGLNNLWAGSLTSVVNLGKTLEISTVHGTEEITEPLLIDLIQSSAFQRLKGIAQHGTGDFFMPTYPTYYRFDHCLGVMMLLRKHGADVKTQAVGLLHDISHTAFSHSTDPLFMGGFTKGVYQDTIHISFLNKRGLKEILAHYHEMPDEMDPEHYAMVDRPKPDLCADRLEYNLTTGVLSGRYSLERMSEIESHLHYAPDMNGGQWYFDDVNSAHLLAKSALVETVTRWGSPESILTGAWTSEILEEALRLCLITVEDIEYAKNDKVLWQLLKKEGNAFIKQRIHWVESPYNYFDRIADYSKEGAAIIIHSKFSGIDPLVKTESGYYRLTELELAFKEDFERIKEQMKRGWCVKLKNGAKLHMNLSKNDEKAA